MNYKISIDFYRDWSVILKKKLEARGYTIDANSTPDQICIKYYGLFHRLISQKPRRVEVSKEFTCPPEYKSGLDLLIEKIKNGGDLTPHLSSSQRKLGYDDGLLNDWGIYHLHLGTEIDDRGLVGRTGPVLFAMFTDSTAYLINIYNHGRGASKQPWGFQELVKIVDNNWPHITGPYKLKGVKPETTVSDEDLYKLRTAGVTVVSVGGMAMAPMGGGVTTKRTSVSVRTMCDDVARHMRMNETTIKNSIDQIAKKIRQESSYKGDEFSFSLRETDTGQVEVNETNSDVTVAHLV